MLHPGFGSLCMQSQTRSACMLAHVPYVHAGAAVRSCVLAAVQLHAQARTLAPMCVHLHVETWPRVGAMWNRLRVRHRLRLRLDVLNGFWMEGKFGWSNEVSRSLTRFVEKTCGAFGAK
eukprot:1707599-Pleurochrysis_carterae.AAC.1